MPDLWASIRSMAKKVLPVLVGPRTAVTLGAGAGVVGAVVHESKIGCGGVCRKAGRQDLSRLAVDAVLRN